MGNCLVTKLKGVVNNDSLLKMGEAKMHVTSTNGNYLEMAIKAGKGSAVFNFSYSVQTRLNGVDQGVVSSITVPENSVLLFYPTANTKLTVSIENKYALNRLDTSDAVPVIEFEGFAYTDMTFIQFRRGYSIGLKANEIANPDLTWIRASGVEGDIESFAGCTNLTDLELSGVDGGPTYVLYGNVESLAPLTGLNVVSFGRSRVNGDLATLFDAWTQAGKTTTGQGVLFSIYNSSVTLKGSTPPFNDIALRIGSGMVNPTEEETAQGWQARNWFEPIS